MRLSPFPTRRDSQCGYEATVFIKEDQVADIETGFGFTFPDIEDALLQLGITDPSGNPLVTPFDLEDRCTFLDLDTATAAVEVKPGVLVVYFGFPVDIVGPFFAFKTSCCT